MIHIWRMWVAVKIFYKHQTEDAFYISVNPLERRRVEDNGEAKEKAQNNFFHEQRNRNTPLKVEREAFFSRLLMYYGDFKEQHYAGKYWAPHGTIPTYDLQNSGTAAFVHDLINSCIENKFIAPEPLNSNILYITDKGIKFRHFSYFLKEIKTELGPTYAWAGGLMLAALGGFSGRTIITVGASLLRFITR
jgi:hypothetical protein